MATIEFYLILVLLLAVSTINTLHSTPTTPLLPPPSPTPAASPSSHANTQLSPSSAKNQPSLPSTQPAGGSNKSVVSSSLYLPTAPSNSSSALLLTSTPGPDVFVVSTSSLNRTPANSINTPSKASTLSATPTDFSKTGSTMTTKFSTSENRISMKPVPTEEPVIGTEPALMFSLTLAKQTATTSHVEPVLTESGGSFITEFSSLPQPSLITSPSASGENEVISKTITIQPSVVSTSNLGRSVGDAFSEIPSLPSLFSLEPTSVRNAFVSLSELLESSVQGHLNSTSSNIMVASMSMSLGGSLTDNPMGVSIPLTREVESTVSVTRYHKITTSNLVSSPILRTMDGEISLSATHKTLYTPHESISPTSTITLLPTRSLQATQILSPSTSLDLALHTQSEAHLPSTLLSPSVSLQYTIRPSPEFKPTATELKNSPCVSLRPSVPSSNPELNLTMTGTLSRMAPTSVPPPSLLRTRPSSSLLPHITSDQNSPTPRPPDMPGRNQNSGTGMELTGSLVSVTAAVCVLFATFSGCIMLLCIYIMHCRKASKVDQIASRQRSVLEIDNPAYFLKGKDESISNVPILSEMAIEHPNQLNISLESNNSSSNDNVAWNSPFTDRNTSQLSIKTATPASAFLTSETTGREEEVIELDCLKLKSSSHLKNEVPEGSHTTGAVPLSTNRTQTLNSKHEYEEVLLDDFTEESKGCFRLSRDHDYEEPESPEAAMQRKRANAYEEPVSGDWKRLSMPSLVKTSLVPVAQVSRRNSSVNEIFTGTKSPVKPGSILHYAEFSLIPSKSTLIGKDPRGNDPISMTDRSISSAPAKASHQYEESSFPVTSPGVRHPVCPPRLIPAPLRLLRGSASDYEVPVIRSPPCKPKTSLQSVMLLNQLRMKLNQLSAGVNSSIDDEDVKRLIDESDRVVREVNSELLRSPRSASPQNPNTESINRSPTMDGAYFFPSSNEEELLSILQKLSIEFIPQCSIESKLTNEQVQHGIWRKDTNDTKLDVTLKAMNPAETGEGGKGCAESNRTKLLQEVVMMRQFRHPNIPRLYGVVNEERQSALVSEYFPRGDLRKILVQMGRSVIQSDTPKLLLTYSQQVALGMQYLASKGFVHRDLCARNVYVTTKDTCKVGGFGKSRDLADVNDYITKGGRIQVRWTAPEAMYYRQYSTASDVWSYGCLLYEIWSLGRMPFRDYTNAEVIEKVDSGYRLPPPPGCPRAIYNLMIQCWHPNPFSRPCFKDIINILLRDEDRTLQIPFRDASTHESAIILGANLKTGAYMYLDLQQRYTKNSSSSGGQRTSGHDYDHIEEEQFMFTFPTSSADLAGTVRNRGSRDEDEEEEEEMGVSLVPQPALYYSVPVECDRSPLNMSMHDIIRRDNESQFYSNEPYDYEELGD